jgi:tricorn protease
MRRFVAWLIFLLALAPAALAQTPADETLMLRFPDIHNGAVVFSYGGDLWLVDDNGGVARRLTGHTRGLERHAKFSPDGARLAFTGDYDGNENVYVMPTLGGSPTALTFHPQQDRVVDWTPSGEVLFLSRRGEPMRWLRRLFSVPITGGLPTPLPLNTAGSASYSPDGARLAFNRIERDFATWKRYKGGTAQDVWVWDFAAQKTTKITTDKYNDSFPMWQGGDIYFISDRNGVANLFAHNLASGKERQVTQHEDFDANWASMGPGQIVYQCGGALWVFEVATQKTRRLRITVPTDNPAGRARWISVKGRVGDGAISPSGKRVALSARGDIFTVPKKKGPTRNLTASNGVRERDPDWSPNGKWIAYFSDRTGEMQIYVRAQDGIGPERQVTDEGAVYRFGLRWSPDSEKLLYVDKNTDFYWVDVDNGRGHRIAHSGHSDSFGYDWSADSRWVVYSMYGENDFNSVYLYSLDRDASTPITGPLTDDGDPTFGTDGRYVFFVSNREMQPFTDIFDRNFVVKQAAKIYAIALTKDTPSPFAPESDEEDVAAEEKPDEDEDKDKDAAPKADKVEVDLDGIADRVVAFPLPAGNYLNLIARGDNVFFLSRPTMPLGGNYSEYKDRYKLQRYNLKDRKLETVISPVGAYTITFDGKHILYREGGTFGILEAKAKGKSPSDGALKLGDLDMLLDPRAEWRQMFYEAWRLERDFFYVENMGGVDWEAIKKKYEFFLPHLSDRDDLTYLLGEMIGELSTSHTYVWGGDRDGAPDVNVGLLGAVFELDVDSGRYRFAEILPPDPWDLENSSPLRQPGLDIAVGDYLLAVNGRELVAPTSPYELLTNTLRKQTRLTIARSPRGRGERDVTVVPIGHEGDLYYRRWEIDNRRKVDEATAGRIGYLHLPDMSLNGLREFSKAFAAQSNKHGLIIDVRYNGGGSVSQMILERLRRELVGMFSARNFGDGTYPARVIHGPMVCITNEYAGSDGDIFPHYFRQYKLGPIVGRRTWGGVVGIRTNKHLVDGGMVTMPEFGTYNLQRQWVIENEGVPPDYEVDLLPEDALAGRDPQLEMAIRLALRGLAEKDYSFPPSPKTK